MILHGIVSHAVLYGFACRLSHINYSFGNGDNGHLYGASNIYHYITLLLTERVRKRTPKCFS